MRRRLEASSHFVRPAATMLNQVWRRGVYALGIILLAQFVSLASAHPPNVLSRIQVDATTEALDAAVTLTAAPSVIENGGWVNVSFSGVKSPSKDDWVS